MSHVPGTWLPPLVRVATVALCVPEGTRARLTASYGFDAMAGSSASREQSPTKMRRGHQRSGEGVVRRNGCPKGLGWYVCRTKLPPEPRKKMMRKSIMCKWTRPFWGTGCRRVSKKPCLRPGSPSLQCRH